VLISTIPINLLAALTGDPKLISETSQLCYSGTHVVGVGIHGSVPDHLKEKNWLYFPEDDCPFYRVTVFSNYSQYNVPGNGFWSLMAEVSESLFRQVDHSTIKKEVLHGMTTTRLLGGEKLASTWHYYAPQGYPTPTIDRDAHINAALDYLDARGILSRGRFGTWKYEVGNQDHTFMQGVEAVDRVLFGAPELTCWYPELVNGGQHRNQRMMFNQQSADAAAGDASVVFAKTAPVAKT